MRRGERPLFEITLRKYERPKGDDPNELLRKFCISIGLLQPGDSRELVVTVFKLLLTKSAVTVSDIQKEAPDAAVSGIRRHLRRMVELKLVERQTNSYRLTEGESLSYIVSNLTRKYLVDEAFARVEDYAKALDSSFKKS